MANGKFIVIMISLYGGFLEVMMILKVLDNFA